MNDFKSTLIEGVNDPAIFKAIFLAGGPGSGKSYVTKQAIPGSLGLKTINSDEVFELKMKASDLQMDPDHLQNVQDRVYNHPPSAYDPIFRGYKAGLREKKEEIIIEPNRLQSTTITKGTSRDTAWNHLLYKLRTFLPMVRPDLVPKHFAALWSKHPCPKQQDHYDFAPPETSLYSAMLSFDDDTRLTILKKGNHVDLRIPRGFVILFGGHLSHSGSEYLVKDNKRLFFKVMPKIYTLKTF